MKRLSIIAVVLMSSVAFAQSESLQESNPPSEIKTEDRLTTAPKALSVQPADSPLVKASKKKPVTRKKAKLHMNNATVKASRGKLSQTPGLPQVEVLEKVPDHSEKLAKYDKSVEEWNQTVAENEKSITNLTQEIEDLENLTGQFEEGFYNEDDPGYREVLEDKFSQAQERLTKAREELAKARENEQTLASEKPRLD